MAGVKSISVGGSPADRRAALLEYAARVRGAPQSGIFLHDRYSLDYYGCGAFVGFIPRNDVDVLGNTGIHHTMDRPILD